MLRRARRFVTVTGTTRGTPDLVVGSRLTPASRSARRSRATATTSPGSATPSTYVRGLPHPLRGRAGDRERGGLMALPDPRRRLGARLLRRLPGHRHRPRRPRVGWAGSRSASRGSAPTATATCAPGRRCARRTPTTTQGLEILPEVGQPGGGRVRGRQPAPPVHRRGAPGTARRRCRTTPERPTTSGCCARGRTAGSSSTTPPAAPKVTLRTTQSGHEVVLDDGAQRGHRPARHRAASVTADRHVAWRSPRNVDVSTSPPPMVNVTAPISTFSGIVKCQTLIADVVVISPAYTPGVGNIW